MGKNLKECLTEHEGSKRFAYKDTLGNITIGVGRCLSKQSGSGLSDDEIDYLLTNDIDRCRKELTGHSFFDCQDSVRQEALIEICFNMGINHLLGFVNALDAMAVNDYPRAIKCFRNSLWASQIGKLRLDNLMSRIDKGIYS